MKGGFRQSMAWLHTWAGLIVGWLLFAIFLTGTAAYFRGEITQWMQPELAARAIDGDAAGARAVDWLQHNAPEARTWLVDLPDPRNPAVRVLWREAGVPGLRSEILDPATGAPAAVRDTRGGDFFYYVHFDLMMPGKWGRLIVGFAAMCMLVAIVSGVVVHRRIFRDFFVFRPRRGQRSWLDAHNALAVLALPYHAMITYTGLVTLMFLYLPWGIELAYPEGPREFTARVYALAPARPAAGSAAPLAPVAAMLETARQHWGGGRAGRIAVEHPGDAGATVRIVRHDGDRVSVNRQAVLFDGPSGRMLSAIHEDGAAAHARGALYGLHLGRFAGPALRWLFFLSGLAGTAMVATGLVLWAVKRAPAAPGARAGFGHRLVRALNAGTVAGGPLAIAAYFWANRLLPAGMTERASAEVTCFFLAWLAALLYPALRPAAAAWRELLWAGGALFAAIPLLNAATSERHLAASLATGDWALAGVDLTALAAGLLLWAVARRLPARTAPRTAAA